MEHVTIYDPSRRVFKCANCSAYVEERLVTESVGEDRRDSPYKVRFSGECPNDAHLENFWCPDYRDVDKPIQECREMLWPKGAGPGFVPYKPTGKGGPPTVKVTIKVVSTPNHPDHPNSLFDVELWEGDKMWKRLGVWRRGWFFKNSWEDAIKQRIAALWKRYIKKRAEETRADELVAKYSTKKD
jgi:hypothetical protein